MATTLKLTLELPLEEMASLLKFMQAKKEGGNAKVVKAPGFHICTEENRTCLRITTHAHAICKDAYFSMSGGTISYHHSGGTAHVSEETWVAWVARVKSAMGHVVPDTWEPQWSKDKNLPPLPPRHLCNYDPQTRVFTIAMPFHPTCKSASFSPFAGNVEICSGGAITAETWVHWISRVHSATGITINPFNEPQWSKDRPL